MQDFLFSLQSFAICSPATGSVSDKSQKLQWLDNEDIDNWKPDTTFIPKKKFRRLSRLSKMALYVAHHAALEASKTHKIGAVIFCSRFGEFQHTERVLHTIHTKELVSPMDFSYSVHNTAQGLFSILQGDNTPATAISASHDGLENALIKAHAQLMDGQEAVMIVYHEDTLPRIYEELPNPINIIPLAFAFVVSKHDGSCASLQLSFKTKKANMPLQYDNIHAQNIAQIIWRGEGRTTLETNRLQWDWHLQ